MNNKSILPTPAQNYWSWRSLLIYLQDIKGIANHAANTARNSSRQEFHVEGSIRTRTQIISHGSIGFGNHKIEVASIGKNIRQPTKETLLTEGHRLCRRRWSNSQDFNQLESTTEQQKSF